MTSVKPLPGTVTVKIGGYRITYEHLTAGDVIKSEGDTIRLLESALRRVQEATAPDGGLLFARDIPAGVANTLLAVMQQLPPEQCDGGP